MNCWTPASTSSLLVRFLLVGLMAGFLGTVQAQDGPLRQRLKERWGQRQSPAASAPSESASSTSTAGELPALAQAGDHVFQLQHGGLSRQYLVHVPASHDPARPAPLLFALHGGGGNMRYQAQDERYGLISTSEKEGAVVVFPNGFSRLPGGQLATWNAGRCCGSARDEEIDDVGFIRAIVERLTRQMNIDRQRIFATGMSNGGMMAYRLACEMPEVFSRIAAVAGTDNTRVCQPAQPVSVLHIHARDDTHVLFNGGAGPGAGRPSAVTDFRSVPDTVSAWVGLNGCSGPPQRILERPGAYCEVHAPCRGEAQVQLCVTETGGHSWPGARKTRADAASQAISANEVMWAFFNRP